MDSKTPSPSDYVSELTGDVFLPVPETDVPIGERIKQIRLAKGLSLEAVDF